MTDFFNIALKALITLVGGIALLVFPKIFVEPIQELKKIIGEIVAYVFKVHSLLADVPDPEKVELKNATEKLQELSAKFRVSINTVPWFPIFATIKLLPPKKDLLKAAGVLSKISYAPSESDKEKISKQIEELYRLLKLTCMVSSTL